MRLFGAAMLLTSALYGQVKPAAPMMFTVPSADLNKELPKWLKFSGVYQGRVEGFAGGAFKNDNSDAYYLNRFRVNMNINPTPWLRFSFQMQDARVWGKNTIPAVPFQNRADLRVAYVEVGDSENKKYGLRGGRQELVFGDMRLIGHLNWVNTARSFDAVRATYRWKGARFDAFASTVVQQVDGEFDRAFRTKADNFHGIWVNAPKLVKNMTIEPYLLWRVTRGLKSETGVVGKRDFKTYGIRFVGKVPKSSFDYNIEMNRQWGSLATDDISAWAGHWMLGYTTPKLHWRPKWMVEYNYASGDKNST
ncbi:MAG: alginate export family protein, partial [Acidobacteriota bacterium]